MALMNLMRPNTSQIVIPRNYINCEEINATSLLLMIRVLREEQECD